MLDAGSDCVHDLEVWFCHKDQEENSLKLQSCSKSLLPHSFHVFHIALHVQTNRSVHILDIV